MLIETLTRKYMQTREEMDQESQKVKQKDKEQENDFDCDNSLVMFDKLIRTRNTKTEKNEFLDNPVCQFKIPEMISSRAHDQTMAKNMLLDKIKNKKEEPCDKTNETRI